MTFGERLRLARTTLGWTQRQLADEASNVAGAISPLHESRIQDLETGKSPPNAHDLKVLTAALFGAGAVLDPDFALAGSFARRPVQSAGRREKAVAAMLADAVRMIAGPARRSVPPVLRGRFKEELAMLAHEVTPALVDAGTERGPRLALQSSNIERDFVDMVIENAGERSALEISLLMPGPVLKRGPRTLPPNTQIELTVRAVASDDVTRALVEYADDVGNVYVQRLVDPATCHSIRRRCLERPKTWYDVNEFIVDRLKGQPFPYALSSRHVVVSVDTDPRAERILDAIDVSREYRAYGFAKIAAPMRQADLPESVVMSDGINRSLWHGSEVVAYEDSSLLDQLEAPMRDRNKLLTDVLKNKYAGLRDEQRFFNEHKLCLGSDLLSVDDVVKIFHGTYFHGFLTNELATKRVCSREEHPVPLFYGCSEPVYSVYRGGGERLGSISESGMSNHIGASVLLFTEDHRIQYWRQSFGEHNVGKANATGSGSCDWDDWAALAPERRSLTALAKHSMVRELREESGMLGSALRTRDVDVRLLGYFRWVRRGGKPEFIGLAKSAVLSSELEPDIAEVDAPRDSEQEIPYFLNAPDIDVLKREIDGFMIDNGTQCALPLWVALTCLRLRCDDDREGVQRFLWS